MRTQLTDKKFGRHIKGLDFASVATVLQTGELPKRTIDRKAAFAALSL